MINIPEIGFGGKPIKGAMARLEAEQEKQKGNQIVQPLNLEDSIYVPSVNLYFSKQKTHLGLNWNKTHEELSKTNIKMPTIKQFSEFLKYLRDNPSNENTEVYNEITEVRDPWRSEWLDAKFEKRNDVFYINYNHELKNGVLVPKNSEPLTDYLTKDKTPGISLDEWIKDNNKFGLPKSSIKKGNLYYWYPRENAVARFCANSVRAYLYCYRNPEYSNGSLGVRLVREGGIK